MVISSFKFSRIHIILIKYSYQNILGLKFKRQICFENIASKHKIGILFFLTKVLHTYCLAKSLITREQFYRLLIQMANDSSFSSNKYLQILQKGFKVTDTSLNDCFITEYLYKTKIILLLWAGQNRTTIHWLRIWWISIFLSSRIL